MPLMAPITNAILATARPDDSPGNVRGSTPRLLEYNEQPDPFVNEDWKIVNVAGKR